MERNLLPIGSVVLIKGGEKRVMVCGRIQTKAGEDTIYDYSACLYPEGIIDPSHMYFFNNDSIERIFFVGFQDPEELEMQEMINNLGELTVKDGMIVPVDDIEE